MTVEGSTVDGFAVEVEERLPGAPERVWALLSDVERMAGLGPEHVRATWSGTERGVGAVFVGDNGRGDREWSVPCTVTAYDPPTRFGWVVGDPASPTASWSYDLAPAGDGTRVRQVFRHGPGGSGVRSAVLRHPEREQEIVAGRGAELEANMRAVLRSAAALLDP